MKSIIDFQQLFLSLLAVMRQKWTDPQNPLFDTFFLFLHVRKYYTFFTVDFIKQFKKKNLNKKIVFLFKADK